MQSVAGERSRCLFCRAELPAPRHVGEIDAIQPTVPPNAVNLFNANLRVAGPELWARLHGYRWTTYVEFRDWFDVWLQEVDKLPGCKCSQNFRSKILPQFADRFCKITSDALWFELTVELHNAVNIELNKPLVALPQALQQRPPS